jgi:hypothetical protein
MKNPHTYNTWFPVKYDWYKNYVNDELHPEFQQWCDQHGVKLQQFRLDHGFMLPNEEVHMLFKLRWGWIPEDDERGGFDKTCGALYGVK